MNHGGQKTSWRQSVGGRWAVSWQGWVVLSLAGSILAAANAPGSVLNWALIAIASSAAMGAVFLIAAVTMLRHRFERPVPVVTVAVVGALAGVARGAAAVGAADALGEDLIRPWPVVVGASGLVIGIATVGLAIAFDHVSRTRAMHAALRAQLADLREQDADRGDLASAIIDVARAEVAAAVDEARHGLDVPVGEMTAADRASVAAGLRSVVDDTLRPLSRRLNEAATRPTDLDTRRGIHWTGLRTLPLFPVTTGIVAGVVSFPMSRVFLGPLVFAVGTWAGLAIAVAVGRWLGWPQHRVVPLALVLVAVAPGAAGVLAGFVSDEVAEVAAFAAGASIALLITLIVSGIGSVLRGEADANARLMDAVSTRQVDALVADREIATASRDLAQHLHGTLQSRMLAVAFALDEAADRDDDEAFRRALTDARLALEEAAASPPPADEADLATALATVASLWRGFVDVEIRITPHLDNPVPHVVTEIARIAEEGVGNAHKHGRARHVLIEVFRVGPGVGVRVSDDGGGPSDGVPGMGSAWLDFVAPGRWSLRPGPGGHGAVLEVRLPEGARHAPVPRVTA